MKGKHEHFYKVTVLRIDGTPWTIHKVKHILEREHSYAIHLGEHGTPEWKKISVPYSRVDHLVIEEED